jgi:hypothetical protein
MLYRLGPLDFLPMKSSPKKAVEERTQPSGHTFESTLGALKLQNYTVIAQDVDEVQDIQNAPAVSMARFLVERERTGLLPTISIYSDRGTDRKTVRILCMNAAALHIWKEMGMRPTEIGVQHRPARTAFLAFGMPFSE